MMEKLKRARAMMDDRPTHTVLFAVGAVTLLRMLLLPLYGTALGPDEAQYWFWGQTLDWGYYSKPPVIAWTIALTTGVFGDQVWAVRLLSPLMTGAVAMALYGIGRRLYGDRAGVWAAITWLFLPAIMLGSTIITTDVPLLMFWSAALFCLVSLADAPKGEGTKEAAALGAAIGFGFLSKYAMIYFPLGWAIAAVLSPYARRTLRPGKMAITLLVAGIIFAPNIIWNIQNGGQTFSHTADNANWSGDFGNPEELLDFLGGQFGVAGPLVFAGFLFALATLLPRLKADGRGRDLFLLSFALPPLLIICVQAFLSRAHANWAMAAYPAAIVLLSAWFTRGKGAWVLKGSLGLHAVVGLVFTAVLLHLLLADSLGLSNSVKRLRGWEEQADELAVRAADYDAVITDEREVAAHLVWEWRDRDIRLMVADLNLHCDNTYEYAFPLKPAQGERYLLVRPWEDGAAWYPSRVVSMEPLEPSFVDLHARRRGKDERTLDLYAVSGFKPGIDLGCPGDQ